MEKGSVERNVIKCLIIGAGGVGKTAIKHLLLSKVPPKKRESTGVIENPVRAVTFSRAMGNDVWSIINNDEELMKIIAEHLKTLQEETNPDNEIKSTGNQRSHDTLNFHVDNDNPRDSNIQSKEKLDHDDNTLKQNDPKTSHDNNNPLLSPMESIEPNFAEVEIPENQTNRSKPNDDTRILNKSAHPPQQHILKTGAARPLENAYASHSSDVSIHEKFIDAIDKAKGMYSKILIHA